jgi:hypothetical protein
LPAGVAKENRIMKTWMSFARSSVALAAFAAAPVFLSAAPATAQQDSTLTEEGVIAGTMQIDYNTRTQVDTSGDLKPDSPALGAQDQYAFTLTVAKTTQFSGKIMRQPNLYSKLIGRRKQDALLTFSVDLSLFNPNDLKQKKTVGKWVGTVPIDTATGAYDLAGGAAKQSALRMSVDATGKAGGFVDNFAGRLIGKAEKKDNLAQYTYKRVIGDKTVEHVVKKVDPMRFEGILLAKGPVETYPQTTVNGRLDYDYETGNWFTDGIRFHYALNGAEHDDIVTGTIKWIEDPDRKTNGKGFYEFNLRYNEEKNKPAASESAAFAKMSDEEAFFAVDNSVPGLNGRVTYVDTMLPGKDVPSSSKITYALNANKLSKQQVMNFFKL